MSADAREQDKGTKWTETVGESCCVQVKAQKPWCDAQLSGCLLLEPQLTCKSHLPKDQVTSGNPGHCSSMLDPKLTCKAYLPKDQVNFLGFWEL